MVVDLRPVPIQGSHVSRTYRAGASSAARARLREPQRAAMASAAASSGFGLLCQACNEPTTMHLSRPTGSNPLQRTDLACRAAWRAYLRRFKKAPQLKDEWNAKSEAEKQQWYRDQKREEEMKRKRRDFGEVTHQQAEKTTTGDEKRERDFGKTYDVYEQEQLSRPRATPWGMDDGGFLSRSWNLEQVENSVAILRVAIRVIVAPAGNGTSAKACH